MACGRRWRLAAGVAYGLHLRIAHGCEKLRMTCGRRWRLAAACCARLRGAACGLLLGIACGWGGCARLALADGVQLGSRLLRCFVHAAFGKRLRIAHGCGALRSFRNVSRETFVRCVASCALLFLRTRGIEQATQPRSARIEQHDHEHERQPGEEREPPHARREIAHRLRQDDADGG